MQLPRSQVRPRAPESRLPSGPATAQGKRDANGDGQAAVREQHGRARPGGLRRRRAEQVPRLAHEVRGGHGGLFPLRVRRRGGREEGAPGVQGDPLPDARRAPTEHVRHTPAIANFCLFVMSHDHGRLRLLLRCLISITCLPQDGLAGGAAQPGEVPADAGGIGAHPLSSRLRSPHVHLRRRVADIRRRATVAAPDAAVPESRHQGGHPDRRRARSVQELLFSGKERRFIPSYHGSYHFLI